MFDWLRTRVGGLANRGNRGLSLVANWLANARWLIDTKFLSLAQQTFKQNEVVFACIRLLSQSVPEPPLLSYRVNEEQGTKTPLPYNHRLVRLIKRPNHLMTEYEMKELLTIHLSITGISHWWKERNNFGDVMALWPLRPDRVGPIYDNNGGEGMRVLAGWSYAPPDGQEFIALPKRDVLTINFPDPTGESGGMVEGFGPTQVLSRQIASDNEATKFVGALLANYAAPTVALKVKAPIRNEKEADLIKAKAEMEFGGLNRGRLMLLDAETDIQVIGFNLQQLEFPEIRNVSETRISAAYGVPAILAGLKAGLQMGNNRASVTEARAYFAETTLSNYWGRIQDQFTEDLAREFGEDLICEFDISQVRALATHFQQKLVPVKQGFEKGVVTRNEYRNALNLSMLPPERGDVFIVPTSMIEIPVTGAAPNQPQALGEGADAAPPQNNHVDRNGMEPDETAEDPSHMMLTPSKSIKTADFDYQTEAENQLAGSIGLVLTDYWDKAVRSLRGGDAFHYDQMGQELTAALAPALIRAAVEQVQREAADMTIGFDPAEVSREASDWADTYIPGLVAGLLDTTRGVIDQTTVRMQALSTLTDEQIRTLLASGFDESRAESIGVSETTRALAIGVAIYQTMLQRVRVRTRLHYHAAHDERTCPICSASDGKREDEVGFVHPPQHASCRCWLSLERVL